VTTIFFIKKNIYAHVIKPCFKVVMGQIPLGHRIALSASKV